MLYDDHRTTIRACGTCDGCRTRTCECQHSKTAHANRDTYPRCNGNGYTETSCGCPGFELAVTGCHDPVTEQHDGPALRPRHL
ncbi:hypothetical protein ACF1DY_26025 [Streptomyces albus]